MTSPVSKTALIIGASRGLGLGLVREFLSRGWTVIATIRGKARPGLEETLNKYKDRLVIEQLEMTDQDAVQALSQRLSSTSLDLLFVNAGISHSGEDQVRQITTKEFNRIMVTNAFSPMRIIEELGQQVHPEGMIAVMSSSLGSVSLNETGGWEVYRASKAALNTFMRSYAARHAHTRRSLALVDPGWVRTDMGGSEAPLTIEESSLGIVTTLSAQFGQPGLRYVNYQGKIMPW